MFFNDKIELNLSSKRTHNGFLQVDAHIARIGYQNYLIDGELKPVMRDAKEVFNPDSVSSWENATVTLDHPNEAVSPENFNKYAVGFARDIKQDGDYLVGTIIITSDKAIKEIESGKTQLSGGYYANTVLKDGVLHQTDIRANHIAIVDVGRCSDDGKSKCALKLDTGDKMADELHADSTKLAETKLMLDAKEKELEAAKLEKDSLKSEVEKLSGTVKVLTDSNEAMAAKLEILALDSIKSEVLSLNKDLKLDGVKTVNDVKVAFIVSKLPTFDSTAASADYVDGVYTALKSVGVNPLADIQMDACTTSSGDARKKMIETRGKK